MARVKTVTKASRTIQTGEPVGDWQAPTPLAAAAHVVGKVPPDPFARAVDNVQGFAPGTRVHRHQGEYVCAILHVGHWDAGQRSDHQMMPADLLT